MVAVCEGRGGVMNLENLKKAEEIRVQIEELEKIINHELTPLEKISIIKQVPKFRLAIKTHFFFSDETMIITSEILSDAIKKALQQIIDDLKAQLVELGVEVE